jgi:hypothetical protein
MPFRECTPAPQRCCMDGVPADAVTSAPSSHCSKSINRLFNSNQNHLPVVLLIMLKVGGKNSKVTQSYRM